MQYLHENGVQHRDLKANNCLVERISESGEFRIKLADFGLSKSKILVTTCTGHSGPAGTVTHMAPELLLVNEFTEKSDVYSFGIVTWEILSRATAFEGLQKVQINAQVIAGMRPSPIPEESPAELVMLMRDCWDQEPFVRSNFDGIVSDLKQMPGLRGSSSSLLYYTTTPSLPPPVSLETPAFDPPPKGSAGMSASKLSPTSNTSSSAAEIRERCDPQTRS